VISLLLLLVALCVPLPVVEVSADDGSPAGRVWLRETTVVTVSYVHSVERTPVRESYQASIAGLRLREVRWQSFGAGLPDEYDDYEDGFYVKRMDVELGRRLTYWFLPLNEVHVSVGSRVVFEGPAEPSRVNLCIRYVPVFMVAGNSHVSGPVGP
jgi:hypothetical protein